MDKKTHQDGIGKNYIKSRRELLSLGSRNLKSKDSVPFWIKKGNIAMCKSQHDDGPRDGATKTTTTTNRAEDGEAEDTAFYAPQATHMNWTFCYLDSRGQ